MKSIYYLHRIRDTKKTLGLIPQLLTISGARATKVQLQAITAEAGNMLFFRQDNR